MVNTYEYYYGETLYDEDFEDDYEQEREAKKIVAKLRRRLKSFKIKKLNWHLEGERSGQILDINIYTTKKIPDKIIKLLDLDFQN